MVRLPWETAQLAMRMRDGGDDGAGAFVDDDARGNVGVHLDRFKLRNKIHGRAFQFFRHAHAHGGGIKRLGAVGKFLVDGGGHARRGSEIRLAQQQFKMVVADDFGGDFPFHQGAVAIWPTVG